MASNVGHGTIYIQLSLSQRQHSPHWVSSPRWAQPDSPDYLTCTSFCGGSGTTAQYSSMHGSCKCHCTEGSKPSDFDRFHTPHNPTCTEYCAGKRKATLHQTQCAMMKQAVCITSVQKKVVVHAVAAMATVGGIASFLLENLVIPEIATAVPGRSQAFAPIANATAQISVYLGIVLARPVVRIKWARSART